MILLCQDIGDKGSISISSFIVEIQQIQFSRFSWWLDKIFFSTTLEDKYYRKIHWKFNIGKKRVIEVWATKNFIKDKMTGMFDLVWRILRKLKKKVKIEVTGPKKEQILEHFQINLPKTTFFGHVTSLITILQFSQKCARVNWPFRSFRLLWNFFIEKRNIEVSKIENFGN